MAFISGFLLACIVFVLSEAIKTRRIIWEYGVCNNKHSRRNKVTSKVYFVLWQAGEQGHMVDYWYEFGSGWEEQFKPYDPDQINHNSRH